MSDHLSEIAGDPHSRGLDGSDHLSEVAGDPHSRGLDGSDHLSEVVGDPTVEVWMVLITCLR